MGPTAKNLETLKQIENLIQIDQLLTFQSWSISD